MKVALISEWVDAWRGGAETSTQQFMHHFVDAGVELHVYTRSRPSPIPGLEVNYINGASMSRTGQSLRFNHRVESLLASRKYDIVHAISPCRGADVYEPRGGTVAESIERNLALRSRPWQRHAKRLVNHLNAKRQYQLRLERALLGGRSGPVVIALSDYVVRQLQEHYHLPADRIEKVFNGVDPDEASEPQRLADREAIRAEFGLSADDTVVLVVAHNFRLKGVHHWLEAQARLRGQENSSIRSLIAGKGDSPIWHRRAHRLGVADRVTFVGPTERIRAFYHAADVLVHPTYYDPCSRVVLEAMASGLPVMTTRWDGSAEVIRAEENGFVLEEPGDVDQMVQVVADLARDPARRRSVGARATQTASEFTMRLHAQGVLECYGRLLSRRSNDRESATRTVLIGPKGRD